MRVAITTWGSRGDFQPYLALARAFAQAGHTVRLGGQNIPEFAVMAAEQRVPFVPLGPPMQADTMLDAAHRAFQIGDPLRQVRVILDELMAPRLEQMYEDARALARWADVLVSHCLQPAGRMAAEATGLPFVTGTLVPLQIPTRHYPPRKLPNFGQWSNRLLWRLAVAAMNAGWSGMVNRVRQRVGLSPLRDLAGDGFYAPDLNLVAVSGTLVATPPDWAPRHRVTGYWFLDQPEWTPPPEVAAFLNQEPKPIAIGFGSMAATESAELTRLVIAAVEQSGVRAIIEPGWANLGSGDLPPTMLCAWSVPHSWLLPRVAAVVHHGGAGTSAAVFRAGIPSVFVPHIFDQEFWAETAYTYGVASPPIPRRELTADRLARAIEMALTSASMQQRAERLGATIRQEDGVGTAVRMVEAYVGSAAVADGQAARLAR